MRKKIKRRNSNYWLEYTAWEKRTDHLSPISTKINMLKPQREIISGFPPSRILMSSPFRIWLRIRIERIRLHVKVKPPKTALLSTSQAKTNKNKCKPKINQSLLLQAQPRFKTLTNQFWQTQKKKIFPGLKQFTI